MIAVMLKYCKLCGGVAVIEGAVESLVMCMVCEASMTYRGVMIVMRRLLTSLSLLTG